MQFFNWSKGIDCPLDTFFEFLSWGDIKPGQNITRNKFMDSQLEISQSEKLAKQFLNLFCESDFHTIEMKSYQPSYILRSLISNPYLKRIICTCWWHSVSRSLSSTSNRFAKDWRERLKLGLSQILVFMEIVMSNYYLNCINKDTNLLSLKRSYIW